MSSDGCILYDMAECFYIHVASCSADKTVRVWKVYHPGNQEGTHIRSLITRLGNYVAALAVATYSIPNFHATSPLHVGG